MDELSLSETAVSEGLCGAEARSSAGTRAAGTRFWVGTRGPGFSSSLAAPELMGGSRADLYEKEAEGVALSSDT